MYVIQDLNGEEIVWKFYEKELQKPNQRELRVEKAIKTRKGYMSNGNATIIFLTVRLMKKI